MLVRPSSRDTSLLLTSSSLLPGMVSIQMARRLDYLEHMATFNAIAAAMLGLVGLGLIVSVVALLRARGRATELWLAAALAIAVVSSYLLDE